MTESPISINSESAKNNNRISLFQHQNKVIGKPNLKLLFNEFIVYSEEHKYF